MQLARNFFATKFKQMEFEGYLMKLDRSVVPLIVKEKNKFNEE